MKSVVIENYELECRENVKTNSSSLTFSNYQSLNTGTKSVTFSIQYSANKNFFGSSIKEIRFVVREKIGFEYQGDFELWKYPSFFGVFRFGRKKWNG